MSWDRHSEAESVELISDQTEKAQREAENGVRQFKAALQIIGENVNNPESRFRLKQSTILMLHEKALAGIHPLAGTYRNSMVKIGKSEHLPPAHHEVPDLVVEMCDYVNSEWDEQTALHLSSYILWRMNWIHPFADGNGRTARILSYVVLSIKLQSVLPGSPTIPDQIASDKGPYYDALEKCDESWKHQKIRMSHMETMLERMLAEQLLNATIQAGIAR